MSLYELLDLLASNYQKIDTLWQFFIWIHMAVLGALFLMPRRVSKPERIVAYGAYVAFSSVNRSALIDTYDYHMVLLQEIARFRAAPADTGGLLVRQIANFHLQEKIAFLAWSHIAAGVLVAVIFIFANAISRDSATPRVV